MSIYFGNIAQQPIVFNPSEHRKDIITGFQQGSTQPMQVVTAHIQPGPRNEPQITAAIADSLSDTPDRIVMSLRSTRHHVAAGQVTYTTPYNTEHYYFSLAKNGWVDAYTPQEPWQLLSANTVPDKIKQEIRDTYELFKQASDAPGSTFIANA